MNLRTQAVTPWWDPYHTPLVYRLTAFLLLLSVLLGVSGEIAYTLRDENEQLRAGRAAIGLEQVFLWSHLTTGEGSLFWLVAAHGYADPRNIAKFPLYPAAARALTRLTGSSLPLSLWLIHAGMVYFGLAEAYRFWEAYAPGYGRRALYWLVCSPLLVLHVWLFDFIEPGLIGLIWLTLTLERQRRWAASSTTLLLLTLLQPSGVILAFLVGLRRLQQRLMTGETGDRIPAGAVGLALLPGVAWMLWMLLTSLWFDLPLAPYAMQAEWGRGVYRLPWERWLRFLRFAVEEQFYWTHVITSLTLLWITIGYVVGTRAWFRLPVTRQALFGGRWVMPVFTVVVVLLPFATSVYGANRYAVGTLIGVWVLLVAPEVQATPWFQRWERRIWLISLMLNVLLSLALVTRLNELLGINYWM